MSRNGSGTFSYATGYPFTTGTVISSTDMNAVLLDIANNLTSSVAKDGQTTMTGNLPMGGFKLTSVGDATTRTQYPSVGQIQDGGVLYIGSVAGTNTITGSLTPSIGASGYATGQMFWFIPANASTGAVTIAINSLAAKAIQLNGSALVSGELQAGIPALIVYDGTQFQLVNPQLAAGTGLSLSGRTFSIDTSVVPRLSATNTFTAAQTISLTSGQLAAFNANSAVTGGYLALQRSGTAKGYLGDSKAISGGTLDNIELATNGSDLLLTATGHTVYVQGVASTDFARLSQSNTFTAVGSNLAWPLTLSSSQPGMILIETDGAADNQAWRIFALSEALRFDVVNDAASSSAAWLTVNRTGATVDTINFENGTLEYGGVEVGFRDIPRVTGGIVRGKCNAITAGITINTSSLSAGYTYALYNDSASDVTITQGSGVTLRLAGTSTTGNLTLLARGFATLWANSGTEVVAMGSVS